MKLATAAPRAVRVQRRWRRQRRGNERESAGGGGSSARSIRGVDWSSSEARRRGAPSAAERLRAEAGGPERA